jgi:hypothetical protein
MRALTTGFIYFTTGFAYGFKKRFMIHNESSIGLGFGLTGPHQSGLLLAAYLVSPGLSLFGAGALHSTLQAGVCS